MATTGYNDFDKRTRFLTTGGGFAIPDGDWTIGLWENNWAGDGGRLINTGAPDGTGAAMSLFFDKTVGGYVVGGRDVNGAAFGSVTAKIVETTGTLPGRYRARITGKFTPRLHIIRRRSGFNEYLVAEAGNAPVLVSSEERPFAGFPARNWNLACWQDYKDMYDGDLEGFFMATVAATDQDIALMSAGWKPSSIPALSGNLPVYFPMETAQLSSTANPTKFTNAGSATAVGLDRMGPISKYGDGPMLRGAIAENTTPAQAVEPTNVVALNNFQQFQVIRHLNGFADVPFTGYDYGIGTADIEIRFHDVEHGTSTAWQTLVSGSAGGGAPINTTLSIPKGYWKTNEIRRVNSAGGTGDSSHPNRSWSRWAVGEVVQVWGDSIQGQVENGAPMDSVAANGYIAKYPSTYAKPFSTNPLASATWNLLHGSGMGGGTQAENEMANRLSDASQCCVGITVVWAGATRLVAWANGGESYQGAKALTLANNGLNKPNIITWVANLASAKYSDDFYANLDTFKALLNSDYGDGTWRLVLAPGPIIYTDEVPTAAMQKLREQSTRWVQDNPNYGSYAGLSVDYLTGDGVHPSSTAWNIMAPRWGNALAYLRDTVNYADPRGGEITSFYRSGNSLFVRVQLHAGTALSLKDPAASITGFVLSSDNFATTIPITAELENATTVRITPSTLPPGQLKLRYLYGKLGQSGNRTLAAAGVDNILYVNAGPTNIVAVQPILGTSANAWSLAEGAAPTPPTITTGNLPAGIAGQAYTQTLAATGGLAPYAWSITSDNLPDGLTLSSDGVISGTPIGAGTTNITVQVAGGDAASSTASFSLTVGAPYAGWKQSRFTPSEISAGSADGAVDFDHDGVKNLLEYAFGGDPKVADATLVSPVAAMVGNALQITFSCDTGCNDITYTVQASETLAADSWIDIAQSVGGAQTVVIAGLSVVDDSGTGRRTVTVTDSTPITGSKRFIRVKVSE